MGKWIYKTQIRSDDPRRHDNVVMRTALVLHEHFPRSPVFWSQAMAMGYATKEQVTAIMRGLDDVDLIVWSNFPWLHPSGRASKHSIAAKKCMVCEQSVPKLAIVHNGKGVWWWHGYVDASRNYNYVCIPCAEEFGFTMPARASSPRTILLADSPSCERCDLLPNGFLADKSSLHDPHGLVCGFCGHVRKAGTWKDVEGDGMLDLDPAGVAKLGLDCMMRMKRVA